MKRDIEQDLLIWKNQPQRMPILLRGARQVGKSYVVEQFGRQYFDHLLVVNFELHPELITCFETIDPFDILERLSLLTHQRPAPGKTLLFLDEIQDCPNAIRALRYFKEQLSELHVIGAGSLLEFTLNHADFRMPVGRVQSLYLNPLSFKEYLDATGAGNLREKIENTSVLGPMDSFYHQHLLKKTQEYMLFGGMPSVLNTYTEMIALGGLIKDEIDEIVVK